MRDIILGMVMVVCSATLFGCNTIKGAGKDIHSIGELLVGGSEHIAESIKNNPPKSQ